MKILRVTFLNLNSLRGQHEIRFDQSPLADAGLFAITGPTGAGKTTLLDAITVGLYGRVHRHDRDAFEIMTRHTGEAFAEVTFEVKDRQYRSKWSLYRSRKKPDGKLQPTHMELFSITDNITLDLKPSEVPGQVAEISGLDYSQFLRSVMLSQGDFTRFLKASEGERSDLLEKITDTGIYSRISVAAYRRADREKKTLEALQAQLHYAELLTAEQVTANQQQVAALEDQVSRHQQTKQTVEQQLNWLGRVAKLRQKKDQLAAQLQSSQADYNAQQTEFSRLYCHQQALRFRPALTQIETTQNQVRDLNQNLQQLTDLLPGYRQQTSQAEDAVAQARAAVAHAQKILNQAEPVLHEVTQQDSVIRSTADHFKKSQEHYFRTEADREKTEQSLLEKRAALRQMQAAMEQTESWLRMNQAAQYLDRELVSFQEYSKDLQDIRRKTQIYTQEQTQQQTIQTEANQLIEARTRQLATLRTQQAEEAARAAIIQETLRDLLAGQTSASLEETCNQLPVLLHYLEQQTNLARHYQQLNHKAHALAASVAQNKAAYAQTEQQAVDLTRNLQRAAETLQHLQQIVDLERQIQKYEADRPFLQPKQPCPLCGSEQHPFVQNHYLSNVSAAEQKRNAQQRVVAEETEKHTAATTRLSTIQVLLRNEQQQAKQVEAEQVQLIAQFNHSPASILEIIPIEQVPRLEELLAAHQREYQEKRQLLAQIRQHAQEERTLEITRQEQKEESLRLEHVLAQTREKADQAARQQQRIGAELADLAEQQRVVTEQVTSFLGRFAMPFQLERSKSIRADLQQRADAYAAQSQRLQQLQRQLTQIETEEKNSRDLLAEKEQNCQQQKIQLQQEHATLQHLLTQRHRVFGARDPQAERESLQQEVSNCLASLEQLRLACQAQQEQMRVAQSRQQQWQTERAKGQAEVTALTQELQAAARAHGIASVETLGQLFLKDEEAHRLEARQKQAERTLTEYRKLYHDTAQELAREQVLALTEADAATLLNQVQQLEAAVAAGNQAIGLLHGQLRRDAEEKERYREIATQVEIQQQEYRRWAVMADLIGSADGKKFSKFAQSLTLARLTELANRHLRQLNDRYRLLKSPGQDLELQIVDLYQADAVRSVNTLSGGESFLVSLALALGLSDLAGRKAQINSLFIDEGFGTLDADTLDIAITALENLQAGGKLIGVISHVEALKERISTQIQVTKQAGGQSTIKVVGCAAG